MKGMLKEIIGDAMVVFFAIWMLICFTQFWLSPTGWKLMGEPNRIVLGIETAVAVAILGLGIERLIDDFRRGRQ